MYFVNDVLDCRIQTTFVKQFAKMFGWRITNLALCSDLCVLCRTWFDHVYLCISSVLAKFGMIWISFVVFDSLVTWDFVFLPGSIFIPNQWMMHGFWDFRHRTRMFMYNKCSGGIELILQIFIWFLSIWVLETAFAGISAKMVTMQVLKAGCWCFLVPNSAFKLWFCSLTYIDYLDKVWRVLEVDRLVFWWPKQCFLSSFWCNFRKDGHDVSFRGSLSMLFGSKQCF